MIVQRNGVSKSFNIREEVQDNNDLQKYFINGHRERLKMSSEYDEHYFNEYKLTKEKKLMFQMFFKEVKSKVPHVKKVLDVGCAFGYFLNICDLNGLETYGIDISSYALHKARKYTKAKLCLLDAGKIKWPFPDNFFDAVTIFDLLEHVKNDKHVLSEAYRVLRKRGLLFATTPNAKARIWQPELSDPTHINVHNRNHWQKLLLSVGFEKVDVKVAISYGFPPLPKLRSITGKFVMKPILFPIDWLGSELFIYAKKQKDHENEHGGC